MSRRRISQREARGWRKRAIAAEHKLDIQANHWVKEWPNGVHIASERSVLAHTSSSIRTARKLGHAVVVVAREDGELIYYACPVAQAALGAS